MAISWNFCGCFFWLSGNLKSQSIWGLAFWFFNLLYGFPKRCFLAHLGFHSPPGAILRVLSPGVENSLLSAFCLILAPLARSFWFRSAHGFFRVLL